MLQQTQVATVLGYYARFLERFPNVAALAAADEQEVLGLWAGLGYYRRARQLHAAAKVVVEQYAGQFPRQLASLQELPGVGRYTAGAIASFAFDQRAPILEANTARLFSRLIALQEPVQERSSQQRLWDFAEHLLPAKNGAGVLNQAAMELGSQVCGPIPECDRCPLVSCCVAKADGSEGRIPVAVPKPVVTPLTHAAMVVWEGKRLLLRQNTADEWWHGLWDLPRVDCTDSDLFEPSGRGRRKPIESGLRQLTLAPNSSDFASGLSPRQSQSLAVVFEERYGFSIELDQYILRLQHSVTRYRITVHCIRGSFGRRQRRLPAGWGFYDIGHLPPLTSPAKQIFQRICPD